MNFQFRGPFPLQSANEIRKTRFLILLRGFNCVNNVTQILTERNDDDVDCTSARARGER